MILGEIERNPTEVLRVSLENFKGRDYIDLRIYYQDDNGEWKPTKKGVTVAPDKLDDVIGFFNKAKEELTKKG